MADSFVLDASVAAKLYFREPLSMAAEARVRAANLLIAPDLILIEVASVATRRVRRGETRIDEGHNAIASLVDLLDEIVPLSALYLRAFALAAEHGFSAYDATYLALAEVRGSRVITADRRLVERAVRVNLDSLVSELI